MKTRRNHLIGRTIVEVDFGPFNDGRGGTAHNPRLILDNGRAVYFVTEETEGDYGTEICVTPKLGHGPFVETVDVAEKLQAGNIAGSVAPPAVRKRISRRRDHQAR